MVKKKEEKNKNIRGGFIASPFSLLVICSALAHGPSAFLSDLGHDDGIQAETCTYSLTGTPKARKHTQASGQHQSDGSPAFTLQSAKTDFHCTALNYNS